MSADAFKVMNGMLQAYALLHPVLRSDAVWEMDLDTFEALARDFRPKHAGYDLLKWFDNGGEVQCLGLRTEVVERAGVRLVFAVIR
jgi:hypothetical protein